jgi:hypothetical protein
VICPLQDYRVVVTAQHIELALPLLSFLRKSPGEQWFKEENSKEKLEM